MLSGLAIYGHDHPAHWRADHIALGRWLAPSTPEDAFDRQPYDGRAGKIRLVGDARFDNRDELIDALGIRAPQAARMADCELLVRFWERWGEATLDRLVGDFAFAVWDEDRGTLQLVRDPVGSRPLFYHEGAGFFAFASMPSGLYTHPDIPCEIDEERAAWAAMLVMDVEDRSFFRTIRAVRPGETLSVSAAGIRRRRYWQPENLPRLRLESPAAYADALRETFDRAVASQVRGTSDVAMQVSAGLDSTCVAVAAAPILARQGRRAVAFTAAPPADYIGLPVPGRIIDESLLAAAVVAPHANVEHVILRCGTGTPFDNLNRHAEVFQQPMVSICNSVWLEPMLDAARARGIGVMLTGFGGNATISHRDPIALRSLAVERRWGTLIQQARLLIRNGHASGAGLAAQFIGPIVPDWMWGLTMRAAGRARNTVAGHTIVHPDLRDAQLNARRAKGLDQWGRIGYGVDTRRLTLAYNDMGTFNKGVLGGWQVDLRHPTVDRRVIELCLSIPESEFVRDGVPASLYRRAFGARLPATLLDETRRGLQGADWHERMVAGHAALLDEVAHMERDQLVRRLFDLKRLRHLAERLPTDGWHHPVIVGTYRIAMLRAISIGHFIVSTRSLAASL